MATITYGSEDAIYGSGVYNEAVYGEFGPTLLIDGVSATSSVGTLTTSAEANTTLNGAEGTTTEGVVQPSGGALKSLTGVSGTATLGQIIIDATTELTGQQLDSTLGTVQVNLIEYITGVTSTGATGTTEELGEANQILGSVSATGFAGDTSETAVVFDFEAVKETYDRRRTIKLPRVA